MASYDPRKAAEKQVRRAQDAVKDYTEGVAGVKESPTQGAKRAKEKMRRNFQTALDDGTFDAGCDSVSKEDWVQRAVTKGGRNYAPGVRDAQEDIMKAHTELSNYIGSTQHEIDSIPNDTEADAKRRMEANFDRMKRFKAQRRRR